MGFEIEDDPDRISFSKLLLDPSQLRTAQQLANFAALQTEYSQETVMHGITMYLMGLKGRALESMKEMWGDGQWIFILGNTHHWRPFFFHSQMNVQIH